MNRLYAKLKDYIRKLFTRKEKFSLVKLMSSVEESLVVCMSLSGVRAFELVQPYYREIDVLLNRYTMNKLMHKNPKKRKIFRKETANKFFNILERLGAIIPKWLSALPPELQENDFDEWKEKTAKGENKDLTKYVKNATQVKQLRKNLNKLADVVADTSDDQKFRKLVIRKIETEPEDNTGNFQIGSPEIVKK